MRAVIAWSVGLTIGLTAMTCAKHTVLVESTPRSEAVSEIHPLDPPQGTVEVPVPEAKWTPEMIGGARGDDLAKALRDKKTLALILPRKGAVATLEDRVFQMIKVAAPGSRVVVRARANLDKLLEERGEIPYRITKELKGTNSYGDPYFVPKEHPLSTDWLMRKAPLKGAEGMLVVRPFQTTDIRLKELRRKKSGDCQEFLGEMKSGLEKACVFFDEYENRANALLAETFKSHMAEAIPFWRAEIEEAASSTDPGSDAAACLRAYSSLLDKYEPCLKGPCPSGPRAHACEGGVVGMVDHALLIPDKCPLDGMRNYAAEIIDVTERAVSEVLPALDNGWGGEIVRYKGAMRLYDVLKDACLGRHRRIATERLAPARAAVTEYLSRLGKEDLKAVWEPARGMERVPAIGPVAVFARVTPSGSDPLGRVSQLKEELHEIDLCSAGREQLYQATVIDVGTSEVLFMGLFFEEELLCDGFAPGTP